MKVLGYGEDALTLWALARRTDEILGKLGDKSSPDSCTLLFRPSFGRRGGPKSSQFGEFDFILATPFCLHLGESKWDQSPEVIEDVIPLRDEQIERHRVFTAYYQVWISSEEWTWKDYLAACEGRFRELGIQKLLPPPKSLLSQNLRHTLQIVSRTTQRTPNVRNVLLVIDSRGIVDMKKKVPPAGFELIVIDASAETQENFIPFDIR